MAIRPLSFLNQIFSKPAPKPRTPTEFVLVAGDRTIMVSVRRNARAKRYSLRVSAKGTEAVVTIPKRGTIAEARNFVERHVGWLAGRVSEEAPSLPDQLPIRGVPHRIQMTGKMRGLISAVTTEAGDSVILVPGDADHSRRRITDYLKREARKDYERSTAHHAARLGVKPGTIRLTDTASRWGSASSNGTLSYSWRLIMAPPMVLDYLVAHEVAHLKEMNHSDRFWAICEMLAPQTEIARQWLKTHGAGLHRAI